MSTYYPIMTHARGWRRALAGLAVAAFTTGVVLTAPTSALAAGVSAEVEGFGLPGGAGTAAGDGAASGGRALLVWSTATATGAVRPDTASSVLSVRARGDQCAGAPVLAVSVDGLSLGTQAVTTTGWSTYSFSGSWSAGSHTIALSFPNDLLSGCDRNLWLDWVSMGSPDPGTSGRVFGISAVGGSARGVTTAVAVAGSLNRRLDRFNFYMAWEGSPAFPTTDVQAISAAGARPQITWEPWSPGAGPWQGRYSLDRINDGSFDWYIDSWARAAAAFGRPMDVRFAHEMNGGWYPWGASVNGNTPAKYVSAYQRVHDRFVAAGAQNVSWVWSPNVVEGMPTPAAQVYPGDAYVDSVAVDGYNGGADDWSMGGWRSPAQVFAVTLEQMDRIAPSKPLRIAETGSAVNGGDKAAWVTQLFSYAKTTRLRGVDWFEFGGYPDWRLTSSTSVRDAARTALNTW